MVTTAELQRTLADQTALITQIQTELITLQGYVNTYHTATAAATSAATSSKLYDTNPYNGNINPGSQIRHKLFTTATSAREKKLDATIKNAKAFVSAVKEGSAQFGWGALTSKIAVDGDDKTFLKILRTCMLTKSVW